MIWDSDDDGRKMENSGNEAGELFPDGATYEAMTESLNPPLSERDEYKPDSRDEDGDQELGEVLADSPGVDIETEQVDVEQPEVTAQEVKRRFKSNVENLRLLKDFGTGNVIGVATWPDGAWAWEIIKLETPTGRLVREIEIDFLADLLAPATKALAVHPTSIDKATTIAAAISPKILLLEICNLVAQGTACHLGLALIAPAVGALTVQIVNPWIELADPLSEAERCLQILDVTVDVRNGELTSSVYDFAVAQLDKPLKRKMRGITQQDLDAIKALIGE